MGPVVLQGCFFGGERRMGGAGSSRLSEKRFQKRDSGAQGGLPAGRETDFAPLSGMNWAV